MDVETSWRAWLSERPDPPLDEALHRVAVDEGSTLPFAEIAAQLQALADGVPADPDPDRRLAHLVRLLFGEHRFTGDRATYDDPSNSRIDRVLASRRGLPILLSAVTMEVGRRAGVPLVGVGFPGHFLVATAADPAVYLDPFHGGRLRGASELGQELRSRFGALTEDQVAEALSPVGTIDLLLRVSTNLMGSWARRGRPEAALRNADRRVALRPEAPELRRDRGLLRAELGHADAGFDLAAYLDAAPDAPDAERIRWTLAILAHRGAMGGGRRDGG